MTDLKEIWLELPTGGRIEKTYLSDCIKLARNEDNYKLVKYKDIVEDAAGHAHCEICSLVIADAVEEFTTDQAWFSNDTWVCDKCFLRFVEPTSFEIEVEKLKQVNNP